MVMSPVAATSSVPPSEIRPPSIKTSPLDAYRSPLSRVVDPRNSTASFASPEIETSVPGLFRLSIVTSVPSGLPPVVSIASSSAMRVSSSCRSPVETRVEPDPLVPTLSELSREPSIVCDFASVLSITASTSS
ncbi:hypothetical protein Pan189_10920 [Stratiformator vulcanicus]|uniref:Uncharacterized protein n=1 Tax=Stratiformator vulcanicus TaxID=2527980 RepID=A0A517QYJ8_9PLAN|nr:hypothetical protein Pan189_10920 [Stratiformator vulcanicus]